LYSVVLQPGEQFPGPDIIGADALAGGYRTVEYVVKSFINTRMFQRQDILRLLHDADLGNITLGVPADRAGVAFGNVTALGTQVNALL
jgi:hypothetical protein